METPIVTGALLAELRAEWTKASEAQMAAFEVYHALWFASDATYERYRIAEQQWRAQGYREIEASDLP